MSEPMTTETLAPCPFCGMKPSDDLSDTLYPSGIFWRHNPEVGCRSYHGMSDRKEGDAQCFQMICNETHGGCGAQVSADSREEVAAKWNRRAQPAKPVQPIAYALEALVDGDWHIQWPVYDTHAAAVADMQMYAKGIQMRVTPLTRAAENLPPGWVAVPVEPTDAMVQAAHWLDLSYMPGQEGADRAAVYRAMLAAAPKPVPVPLTTEQIEAIAHRTAWRYKKSSDPHHSDTYTFNRHTLIDFVCAITNAQGAPDA